MTPLRRAGQTRARLSRPPSRRNRTRVRRIAGGGGRLDSAHPAAIREACDRLCELAGLRTGSGCGAAQRHERAEHRHQVAVALPRYRFPETGEAIKPTRA